MADNSTLARPYAKAVFELARESGQLQSWSASLQSIAGLVADPNIAGLIAHPALSRADLAAVLAKAFGDASKEVLSLVRVLIENGRLSVVAEIAAQYEQLRAEAEARVDVEITTAVAVGAAQQDGLAAAIRKRLSREVNIEWTTDESLIAGAVIRAGDLVIDGSVKSELEKLETALAR